MFNYFAQLSSLGKFVTLTVNYEHFHSVVRPEPTETSMMKFYTKMVNR